MLIDRIIRKICVIRIRFFNVYVFVFEKICKFVV